eukprot:gnl/MRDRNA2_/MRDRNA2_64509_c0_seq2.p1 gnl/MRDRNA2_/MRDRNA2_64509_c0~~gnl/MRDRNA2_/MRDRNA2_64509_c0_seq2.p1  ORF type:complete len:251 (-),score=30.75 gnl/MRDRNA2_/MRDRNA2_64509_c0_seq2:17-769(-)
MDQLAEWFGTAFAFFFFLSPVVTVHKVHKSPNMVHNVNPLNLLSIYGNCSLWLIYGLFLPIEALIPPNSVGFVSSVYCIASCWWHATKMTVRNEDSMWNRRAAAQTAGCFIASVIALIYVGLRLHEKATEHVGNVGMVINILMFAAPLSALKRVLQTRSSAALPFLQCFMGLLCSSCWAFVGFRKDSPPVLVPNGIGVALSSVQLGFICYFPSTGSEAKHDDNDDEVQLTQKYGAYDPDEREPLDSADCS